MTFEVAKLVPSCLPHLIILEWWLFLLWERRWPLPD
jgi:hypothetical protein